jgi:hypothetical protein
MLIPAWFAMLQPIDGGLAHVAKKCQEEDCYGLLLEHWSSPSFSFFSMLIFFL